MQSFIISGKNNQSALKKAREISVEKGVDKFDFTEENFEKPVGIADIRNIQKNIFLKPLRNKFKSIIINASSGITLDSQNALLKTLEEPPSSALIFLIVEEADILLPTVISRCKVIKLEKERVKDNASPEMAKIIDDILSDDTGIKLKLAQDFGKSREESIGLLEDIILSSRQMLLSNLDSNKNILNLKTAIEKLEEGRLAVKNTNVNPRFVLENTLLSV